MDNETIQIQRSNQDTFADEEGEPNWSDEKTWMHYWELQEQIRDYQIDQKFVETQKDPEVRQKQFNEDLEFIEETGSEAEQQMAERLRLLKSQDGSFKAKKWKTNLTWKKVNHQ